MANALKFLLFILLPSLAQAKIYYVNRGVRYHIGDNHYEHSEDAVFVGSYPVVGQEWIQAFRVTEKDRVKVHIDNIWGVDNCPYCKDIVGIDDHDMGRLTQENNHIPFDTLEPLAMDVEPGKTYLLKVVSYGEEEVDDFVIEGVSVESQKADVIFLKPGPVVKNPQDALPEFTLPIKTQALEGPCPGVDVIQDWILGLGKGKDELQLPPGKDFSDSGTLGQLKPGEAVEFYFRAEADTDDADQISRVLEILSGEKDGGWVFTFDNQGRFSHGNMRVDGNYRSARFHDTAFRSGQWNRALLSFCRDGQMRLWVNGSEINTSLAAGMQSRPFFVRSLGMKADLAAVHMF